MHRSAVHSAPFRERLVPVTYVRLGATSGSVALFLAAQPSTWHRYVPGVATIGFS